MSDNLIVTGTSMLSSIILESRNQAISEERLKAKATWLFQEINARTGLMSISIPPSTLVIRTSLSYLKDFVEKKQEGNGSLIKMKSEFKDVMMLSYYRNNLVHLFINEAYIACAILAFGHDFSEELGIAKTRIKE